MSQMESPHYEAQGSTYGRYEGTPHYQQAETSGQTPPYSDMYDDAFMDSFVQRFFQRMYQGQQGKLNFSVPGQRISAAQRLALAIVSVCILAPLGGVTIGLVAVSHLWIVGLVALLIFVAAIVLINIIFNLSH
jgi:hypothetical protein